MIARGLFTCLFTFFFVFYMHGTEIDWRTENGFCFKKFFSWQHDWFFIHRLNDWSLHIFLANMYNYS